MWFQQVAGPRVLLVLTWQDLPQPRYYTMAMPVPMVEALERAHTQSLATGQPLMFKNPFGFRGSHEDGDDTSACAQPPCAGAGNGSGQSHGDSTGVSQQFYAAPQPPLEEKQ